ncbi:MAG TPA: hypothetical protein VMI54_18510, partial [Polyangiaceae bacterium]|nr:hypothetical protein [Polyangiaceae bacterium]
MKVRAVAVASERSNAIGTVELECTPHGLMLVHLGVGSFSEDYAPGALTTGTRVLVPWAAIERAEIEADRLFLAFEPALSPHHRLLLANFSTGTSVDPRTLRRKRLIARIAAGSAALVVGLAGAEAAARLLGTGPAIATGLALGGALAVLLVGLFADRLLAQGGLPQVGVREAFEREMDVYLPALERSETPAAPKKLRALTLAELQGLLPRTTFAIVVTLTASGLAFVLVAHWALSGQPERRSFSSPPEEVREKPVLIDQDPTPAPPPKPAARAPAPPPKPPSSAPAAATGALALGDPCRCDRSD